MGGKGLHCRGEEEKLGDRCQKAFNTKLTKKAKSLPENR